MSLPLPRRRKLLHAALAALVLVATLHCAWESQAAIRQIAAAATYQAANQSLPIFPRHGCDNESGCICRGATQVQAVDASHCRATLSGWLAADWDSSAGSVAAFSSPACFAWLDEDASRPPLSGRLLRALYASLVI